MPEFHAEPYLHLAGLSHKSALIAWGAFYFRTQTRGGWKLVEDRDLRHVHPPRRDSIGARSAPYGAARVNVYAITGELAATAVTETANFSWVSGLQPDTRYRYEVMVNGEPWGQGERWDWMPGAEQGFVQAGGHYLNEFRTHPDPARAPSGAFTFIVLGDYGTGIRKQTPKRRQRAVAESMNAVFQTHDVRLVITAGDNIYAGTRLFGLPIGSDTGDEDDDWFFTFFQPYRYIINRVPTYPCIGNHDAAETEDHDDREQLMDNLYLRERIAGDEAAGRASVDPGLFYRFRYGRDVEFICLDTSKEGFFRGKRLFEYPKHWEWIEQAFASDEGVRWRLPFCHHPPYCAGPRHHNTDGMDRLLPLFACGGARVVFSGHEHNFQHSRVDGLDTFVTGAGSKVRKGAPDDFDGAHTVSWSDDAHFLLVTIDGSTMRVRVVGEMQDGRPAELVRHTPSGEQVSGTIVVER